jgi:hypothetical protein
MNLSLSSNIAQMQVKLGVYGKQVAFATAKALTTQASELAKQVMPKSMDAHLDRPTPFSKQGFFTKPADKRSLTAIVGIKRAQVKYLALQVRGGTRSRSRTMIGGAAQGRNEYGNVPRAVWRVALQAMVDGKSKGAIGGYFIGHPHGLPLGLYQRVAGRHLKPVFIFATKAVYKKRWDVYAIAKVAVSKGFSKHFIAAWQQAIKTAR